MFHEPSANGGILRAMRRIVLPLVFLTTALLCTCYSVPRTEAVIAARDLPVEITIQEADLKMVNIPSSDVPPGNFRGKSGVVGHKTLVPISKNEFILTSGVSR